jgi:hypothetical protein
LRCAFLCDSIRTEGGGKVSYLGVFTNFVIKDLLAPVGPFSIAFSAFIRDWNLDSKPAFEKWELLLKNPQGENIALFNQPLPRLSETESKTGKPHMLNIVVEVSQLKFQEFGNYSYVFYFDGEEIGRIPFEVRQG